jgi:hypothetical protein
VRVVLILCAHADLFYPEERVADGTRRRQESFHRPNLQEPGSVQSAPRRQYRLLHNGVPIRQNNPDEEVSPEDRVKAYRYGKEQVPFSKEDEAQLKLSTEKCLRCGCDLCCSPEYNLPVSVQTYCIHRRGQNQE